MPRTLGGQPGRMSPRDVARIKGRMAAERAARKAAKQEPEPLTRVVRFSDGFSLADLQSMPVRAAQDAEAAALGACEWGVMGEPVFDGFCE
jgi:hypothetical protein